MSALFRSEFYTRMKRYWGENISIYDSKVKLFLKQGISCQLGRGWTQLFDLNARIQQLTWSLIFYEKYSTSLSTIVLVVLTTANFGGFSNFCRYYTRSQAGKSTGYRPTLKPLGRPVIISQYIKPKTCTDHMMPELTKIAEEIFQFLGHIRWWSDDRNTVTSVIQLQKNWRNMKSL